MKSGELRFGSSVIDVDQLVREYVAQELMREMQDNNGKLMVRVLGEVLANKAGFTEAVSRAATDLVRELLTKPKGA